MKKSMLFMVLILSACCLMAQNIQLPTVEIKITPDLVPPRVKDAFMKDFGEEHQPMVWATTKSTFDTYGWQQSVDVNNQEIMFYTMHTKAKDGSNLDAVYTPDGKLVRSREEVKNFEPPKSVMDNLQKSEYKDWKIAKDVHVIKVYEGKTSKDHYDLKMEKGKQKKSLYFDKDGNMLMNKKKM